MNQYISFLETAVEKAKQIHQDMDDRAYPAVDKTIVISELDWLIGFLQGGLEATKILDKKE